MNEKKYRVRNNRGQYFLEDKAPSRGYLFQIIGVYYSKKSAEKAKRIKEI